MKAKYKNIVFVTPDPESFISGGNIYNPYFLKTLRKYDPGVRNIDFATFLNEKIGSDLYFIDTFYFEELKTYQGDLSEAFLMVHLLESLNVPEVDRVAYFKKEEKKLLDRFAGFLSTSDFTKAYLWSLGYDQTKHLVLAPAISFTPRPKRQQGKKINALMVNNLMARKGIIEFLTALIASNITKAQFHLTIIGDDRLEPAYAEKCKKLLAHPRLQGLVSYLGVLAPAKVRQYFESSNLYISAALMETFGMALQEAVAYRMPILALNGGNTAYHIKKDHNGYLFDTNKELVSTLQELCSQSATFQRLVESAWQFRDFEDYTWDRVIKNYVQQLYLTMMN